MEFLHSLDDARDAAVAHCGTARPAGSVTVRRLWRGLVTSYPDFALPRHLRWLAESGQLADGQRVFLVTWRATNGLDAPPRLRHLLVDDADLSVRDIPADA